MQNPNLWVAREVLFTSDYKNGIDSQKERGRERKRKEKVEENGVSPVPVLSTMDKALPGRSHSYPVPSVLCAPSRLPHPCHLLPSGIHSYPRM